MSWDFSKQPFIIDITVTADDIDELSHVNNAVYVKWLEQCAWQHSGYLGLNLAVYQQLDRAMVVLRHEIDYLAAAYCDEQLQLATWIVETDKRLKLTRHFQLIRTKDQTTILRAKTAFCCVQLSTGKPKRMPAIFIERYGQAAISVPEV